nr:MAG TPA: hypothetical protein [Caudoviricetes sp.]
MNNSPLEFNKGGLPMFVVLIITVAITLISTLVLAKITLYSNGKH